jgi:hypothetical protein
MLKASDCACKFAAGLLHDRRSGEVMCTVGSEMQQKLLCSVARPHAGKAGL